MNPYIKSPQRGHQWLWGENLTAYVVDSHCIGKALDYCVLAKGEPNLAPAHRGINHTAGPADLTSPTSGLAAVPHTQCSHRENLLLPTHKMGKPSVKPYSTATTIACRKRGADV